MEREEDWQPAGVFASIFLFAAFGIAMGAFAAWLRHAVAHPEPSSFKLPGLDSSAYVVAFLSGCGSALNFASAAALWSRRQWAPEMALLMGSLVAIFGGIITLLDVMMGRSPLLGLVVIGLGATTAIYFGKAEVRAWFKDEIDKDDAEVR